MVLPGALAFHFFVCLVCFVVEPTAFCRLRFGWKAVASASLARARKPAFIPLPPIPLTELASGPNGQGNERQGSWERIIHVRVPNGTILFNRETHAPHEKNTGDNPLDRRNSGLPSLRVFSVFRGYPNWIRSAKIYLVGRRSPPPT